MARSQDGRGIPDGAAALCEGRTMCGKAVESVGEVAIQRPEERVVCW